MANAWIEHVKEYAKKNGMKYPVAVGDPGCKAAYKKGTQKKNRKYRGGDPDCEGIDDPEKKKMCEAAKEAAAKEAEEEEAAKETNPNPQESETPYTNLINVKEDPSTKNPTELPTYAGGKRRSRKAKGSRRQNKKSQKRRRRK